MCEVREATVAAVSRFLCMLVTTVRREDSGDVAAVLYVFVCLDDCEGEENCLLELVLSFAILIKKIIFQSFG